MPGWFSLIRIHFLIAVRTLVVKGNFINSVTWGFGGLTESVDTLTAFFCVKNNECKAT
ncbi:MAG: hypothetical protein HY960_04985 [Ignavibacteriae bacterium]|nr:hypothetical protein [Ignavibacteriota bacterium]